MVPLVYNAAMSRLLAVLALLSLLLAIAIGALYFRSFGRADQYIVHRDEGVMVQFASHNGAMCWANVRAVGYGTDEQMNHNIALDQLDDARATQLRSVPFDEFAWTDAYGAGAVRGRAEVVPYRYTFAMALVVPVVWVITVVVREVRRRKRIAANRCGNCGYDLRASSGRCPECGEQATARR